MTGSLGGTYYCSSGSCVQPYSITYGSGMTSYSSDNQLTSSCTSNGTALTANGQTGPSSAYNSTVAAANQQGTWFPGTPCNVQVTNLGCYLAWSNSTHYFEEGNYDLGTLNYLSGCPNCSRTPPTTMDGMCSNDGSLECSTSASKVNYKCTATRVTVTTTTTPTPTPTPAPSASTCSSSLLEGTWQGACYSMTGSLGGTSLCAAGACAQPYSITYKSSQTSYTSSAQLQGTCALANGTALAANAQSSTATAYTAAAAAAAQQGSWFPGVPCDVQVTGLGCYLAWSNSTHYFEEGNYDLATLNYLTGCPDCSRAQPSPADGMCSSDGSLECASGKVNYRCLATKVVSAGLST
eukprot:CAMPEP_0113685902 /NCGR_PEP_ID=MMETSP0038_2-20120614/14960_1 /TAXON_ID=2898 /ORGANISM="Cryptomonas paramecium" /LENGTH=350 /DNA_ID=CAMNT_0000606101 /DNA_START=125 /DNA_END=1174 /DNA_ORIENTATION=+ /assembly_acc=CAM_ASM_000170